MGFEVGIYIFLFILPTQWSWYESSYNH